MSTASDAFRTAADGAPGWEGQAWTTAIQVPPTEAISFYRSGEFVDLLRMDGRDTSLLTAGRRIPLTQLAPLGASSSMTSDEGSLTTRWHSAGPSDAGLVETARLLKDGTTFEVVDVAQGGPITKTLRSAGGSRFTSVTLGGREATVCFTSVGEKQPCVRVWAAQPDAIFRHTSGVALFPGILRPSDHHRFRITPQK